MTNKRYYGIFLNGRNALFTWIYSFFLFQTWVPVFSFPFNVAIQLVLAISKREGNLVFIERRRFPELHLYLHYFQKQV